VRSERGRSPLSFDFPLSNILKIEYKINLFERGIKGVCYFSISLTVLKHASVLFTPVFDYNKAGMLL